MTIGNCAILSAPQKRLGEPHRKTGLDAVGDAPWGTHFCLLHASRGELLETLAPYFAQGLAANEYCMWITSQTLKSADAERALRELVPGLDAYLASGQIEILDFDEWYMADDRFVPERALEKVAAKLTTALARGFEGLRLTSSTFSLAREDWEAFLRYEAAIDRIIGSKRVLALCAYSLQKWSMREIFDVIATHDFALIREDGRWVASKSFSRQRIEQGLKESEARLRATVEGVGDGIITTDATSAIVSMNPAAVEMFGYALHELAGENIGLLSPNPTRVISLADVLETQATGREAEGRRKDGALFPIEWTITQSFYDDQHLFIIVVRDLSERVQTEARMQKLRADRLLAMGGMATALAHEVNQPLAAAATYLGAAQRLLARSLFRLGGLEQALTKAADQVARAGQIVGRMRSFVAHGEPDVIAHSMYELAREAHEFSLGVGAGQVEVSFRLNTRNDRVLADKVQIQQVLVNLMRNAIEAMSASETRKLTLSISRTDMGMIRTDIADTGPGLSAEIRENLFEPFKTTKATGMGVGLSISRSIVQAHHGSLWAEADRGGGAVFSFTLPSADMDAEALPPSGPPKAL